MSIWTTEPHELNDGPVDVCDPDIGNPQKKTIFTLHQHFAEGIEYYHLEIVKGCLSMEWERAAYIQRGKAELLWPGNKQLPPWPANPTTAFRKMYRDKIRSVLFDPNVVNANTVRLEGDIEFGSFAEPQTFQAALSSGQIMNPVTILNHEVGEPPTTIQLAGNYTFVKRVTMFIGKDAIRNPDTNEQFDLFLVDLTSFLYGTGGTVDDGTAHGNMRDG